MFWSSYSTPRARLPGILGLDISYTAEARLRKVEDAIDGELMIPKRTRTAFPLPPESWLPTEMGIEVYSRTSPKTEKQ